MHKSKRWLVFWILLSLQLTGCTTMNSQFDCPMKNGIRCESLDQVNSRVDRGEIGHEKWPSATIAVKKPCVTCQHISLSTLTKDEPIRIRETVLPIWIAPYEDTEGNYHQESEVFTVAKPGYWKGNPPKVLINEE